MDAAETWLQEHDPVYLKSRQDWKHLNEDGEYETPAQEVPWGDANDLEDAVAMGIGRYVEAVPFVGCAMCGLDFKPQTPWHRYCSEACQQREAKRRQRRAA